MAVFAKVSATKLKFDEHALPAVILLIYTPLGLAVRVAGLNGLDDQPELVANPAKDVNDALLIDGCVTQASKADRCPKLSPIPLCPTGPDLIGK
jgi:hypothetical protein